MFTLGLSWLPIDKQRFRLVATGLEIVWGNGENAKFTIDFDYGSRVELDQIYRFSRIMAWLTLGPIDVQIWAKDARLAGGALRAKPYYGGYDWQKIVEVLETLKSLLPTAGAAFYLSVTDINLGATSLYQMYEVVSSPSIRLEFFAMPEHTYDFTTTLYYSMAEAGGLTAFALVERKVRNWAPGEDGRRCVEFGPPVIRESWVVESTMSAYKKMIADDYAKHLAALEKEEKVLVLNNISDFIRSLKEPEQQLVIAPSEPNDPL